MLVAGIGTVDIAVADPLTQDAHTVGALERAGSRTLICSTRQCASRTGHSQADTNLLVQLGSYTVVRVSYTARPVCDDGDTRANLLFSTAAAGRRQRR